MIFFILFLPLPFETHRRMPPVTRQTLLSLLTCVVLLPGGALAHDLWLSITGKQWTLYQGHRHSTHDGADTVPYTSGFVTRARCLDAEGKQGPLAVAANAPWSASGDCAALRLDVSSGYWSKTPWETKNVPKNEAPGALKSWLALESLLLIERWNVALAKPAGSGLELLPTADPFLLKPGDKLVVRATHDGKPLAEAPVAYHGETRGTTDADGRIAIRLRHRGVQLISTSLETRLNDGKADREIRSATLQFSLPQ